MSTQAEKIKRVLSLLPYLEANRHKYKDGIPLKKVLDDFGINIKELIKDINIITMCGIPPYSPYDLMEIGIENDSIVMEQNLFDKPGRLTLLEALSLYLGSEIIASQKNTTYAKIIENAKEKIKKALTKEINNELDKQKNKICIEVSSVYSNKLQIVQQAINENKKIEMEYYTKGRKSLNKRIVSPYIAIVYLDKWYIVGYCELAKEQRTFLVSRMKSVKLTNEQFDLPDSFDKSKYDRYASYSSAKGETEVKLKFSPKISRWIIERADKKEIKRLKDGSVILTLKNDSIGWLVQEVLGYGEEAEVLSPPEIKNAVKSACIRALKNYM